MPTKIELLPCPFCGSDRVRVTKPTMWQAWCMDCKAIGAASLTEQEAIEAWNTRTPGWIPCSERMPEEETYTIIYCPHSWQKCRVGFFTQKHWYVEDIDTILKPNDSVTHWMPLPETPKGE